MASYTALKFAELAAKDNRLPPSDRSAKKIITWDKSGANRQDKKRKTNEDALRRRKERFGEVSPPRPKYSKVSREVTLINSISASNLEILKKRSERFGESVSALMKEIEEKDKLMKRQARFSTKIPITAPSKDTQLHVKVFNDRPSNVIELFQTIDQIDSQEKRKIKLQLN